MLKDECLSSWVDKWLTHPSVRSREDLSAVTQVLCLSLCVAPPIQTPPPNRKSRLAAHVTICPIYKVTNYYINYYELLWMCDLWLNSRPSEGCVYTLKLHWLFFPAHKKSLKYLSSVYMEFQKFHLSLTYSFPISPETNVWLPTHPMEHEMEEKQPGKTCPCGTWTARG